MADPAPRDENRIPVAVAVSSVDGITPLPIQIDPVSGGIVVESV